MPCDLLTDPSLAELEQATGEGIKILIADSGVDASHPQLAGLEIPSWRVHSWDGVTILKDSSGDAFGHGTAIASILHRFAPGAELHSLRVLSDDLRGSSDLIIAGLHWALEQGYSIINCSFTSSRSCYIPVYKQVVDKAFCKNVLLVSACSNLDFRRLEYPAAFPSVLSTDCGNLGGLGIERRPGQLVEFVCRGEDIVVAWQNGDTRKSSGSSFAAPHLAALAARLRQLRPQWNACEIKAFLYRIAARPEWQRLCAGMSE